MIRTQHPIHERLPIGLLLAMNSGFVDAYTFQYHESRFASLQTGNLIQAGFNLAHGRLNDCMIFIWPILFFTIGAACNTILKKQWPEGRLSSQQHSILLEFIGITAIVTVHQYLSSTFFIAFLSFFLAIQLDSFPKLQGLPFTSVMSTGNLRSVGTNITNFFYTRDKQFLSNTFHFLWLVLAFLFGAFISGLLAQALGTYALFGASLIVLIVFGLLFKK
jgi:uncharacterized membrane protein YoaK (UPF0700 family)